jgi:hypothetical protein
VNGDGLAKISNRGIKGAEMKLAELCRRHEISDLILYRWRSRYVGLETFEVQRNRRQHYRSRLEALDTSKRSRTYFQRNGHDPRRSQSGGEGDCCARSVGDPRLRSALTKRERL